MLDEAYIDVLNEWWHNHQMWLAGTHPKQLKYPEEAKKYRFYAEFTGNPPNIELYNPVKWSEKEKVCFQLYENVTEGTPVSPVFDTLKDTENWLVDIKGWERDAAKDFCKLGYLPTINARYLAETSAKGAKPASINTPHSEIGASKGQEKLDSDVHLQLQASEKMKKQRQKQEEQTPSSVKRKKGKTRRL
jgi:hypothetical protein